MPREICIECCTDEHHSRVMMLGDDTLQRFFVALIASSGTLSGRSTARTALGIAVFGDLAYDSAVGIEIAVEVVGR